MDLQCIINRINMINIKQLWNNWIEKIQKEDNKQFHTKIEALELEMKNLKSTNENLTKATFDAIKEIEKREVIIIKLDQTIETLKETKNSHNTLTGFLDWMDKNIPKAIKYHTTQNGRIRPHTVLKITDYDKVLTFAKNNINLKTFKNEDALIYHFNNVFDMRYKTYKYYKHDIDVWGKKEYWETPEEVIDLIEKKKTFSDCDSVMILKWACMKALLDDFFPDWDVRRLRGFAVRLFMIGGGHAVLGWVKEGVNDWIPIETTYYKQNFKTVWNKNYTFRNNKIAYGITMSFDDKNEYLRI